MKNKFLCIGLVVIVFTFPGVSHSQGTEDIFKVDLNLPKDKDLQYINVVLGASLFTGSLGVEYQRGYGVYAAGYPGFVSFRYFGSVNLDSWFWGLYIGSYDLDAEVDYKNHKYNYVSEKLFGIGVGYRWQWRSGWNVNLNFGIDNYNTKYLDRNTGQTESDKDSEILPGISIGYKF
ncbi:MAG: hypothetical protein OEZ47_16765 [Gammaproteobacteria bacterium]|nr:hypothetical protein [Gammaproteobacteria bacterium]